MQYFPADDSDENRDAQLRNNICATGSAIAAEKNKKKSHQKEGIFINIYKLRLCVTGSEVSPDDIQCTTSFEPFNLLFIVGMVHQNSFDATICMIQHEV